MNSVNFICKKFSKEIRIIKSEPILLLAFPVSLISFSIIFILSTFVKIRVGFIRSEKLGHFAADIELYLCERDNNNHSFIDIFYLTRKPCNKQLAIMWARKLRIFPLFFLRPLDLIIRSFSFLSSFHVQDEKNEDRDIDNLYEKFPPHLDFTAEELVHGQTKLMAMGIPKDANFICMTIRDNSYLNIRKEFDPTHDCSYHNYRDSDIQNYNLAAESLAERGYFVFRMGVKVNKPLNSRHPNVIDYSTNGMRSDFMDIYLGAKCKFCITVGTGFDAIPMIFRRPIVQVNAVPLGYSFTWGKKIILLTKHHIEVKNSRKLALNEIFKRGLGSCLRTSDYESKGIRLIENTPEEIRDAVIEMEERISGTWKEHPEDKLLQKRFWEIFDKDALDFKGKRLHGKIYTLFSASFLRSNKAWLS